MNRVYTKDEVVRIIDSVLQNLENGIDISEENMAKKIRRPVTINGKKFWICGQTEQQVMDSYVQLCEKNGMIQRINNPNAVKPRAKPLLENYITDYLATFKTDQESLTKINRSRIIKNHIIPRFGDWEIDKITVTDLQIWFNELGAKYSHETLMKIKNTMSPIMDSAFEDGYIERNPLKSSRIKLKGRETVHHRAIPKSFMDDIVKRIDLLEHRERVMTALLCSTGMRFQEILGLRWEDIDIQNGWIRIERAVVHPDRNTAEIKSPKTKSSIRRIPISRFWIGKIVPIYNEGFVLYSKNGNRGENPLSYTEARRSFEKIRHFFQLYGYSAHDFRDTCATQWREAGIPLDVVSRLLGHSNTDTTEQRYVKYRASTLDKVRNALDP